MQVRRKASSDSNRPRKTIIRNPIIIALLLAAWSPALASDLPDTTAAFTGDSFSTQYTAVTKKILKNAVEIERFSLNYRLETLKQPKLKKLRYFVAQEAGAAGGLAFEITGLNEYGKGRKRPLTFNKRAFANALKATMITSIIAGSSSAYELGNNTWMGLERRKHGYDSNSAKKFVVEKLKTINELLAQRQQLVNAHKDHPAYERAVAEGEVFCELRDSFLNEFAQFYVDNRRAQTMQNTFYALNAGYNAIGATAAGVGYRAISRPKFTGTSNILFIVSGGMATVTPMIATASGALMRKYSEHQLEKVLPIPKTFDSAALSTKVKLLEGTLTQAQESLMPSLSATRRLGMYSDSQTLFRKQLDNELTVIRRLDKVALQTNLLAPPIGSLLMTQGILGTVAYYDYPGRVRKQLDLNYKGAVAGTVGLSMSLAGNAGWLLTSLAYEHRLRQKKQLPSQLIQARLEHLDDIDKTLAAL